MIRLTDSEVQDACKDVYYPKFDTMDGYDQAIAKKIMDAMEFKENKAAVQEAKAQMDRWTPQDSLQVFSIPVLDSIYEQEIAKISTLQFNSKEMCKFFYGKMRAHLMKDDK